MLYQPEPVNQGIVTSRDPATLNAGELQEAAEAFYKPGDPALHPVAGQASFSTALTGTVHGMRYVERDDSSDLIVAHAGSSYYVATLPSGTFTTIPASSVISLASGRLLESIQLGEKTVLLNGVSPGLVFQNSPTSAANLAPLAFNPVPYDGVTSLVVGGAPPAGGNQYSAHQINVVGGWNQTESPDGYYWYWYTEYNDVFDIESGFTGTPVGVEIGGSHPWLYSIKVQMAQAANGPVNAGATHWRLYRSFTTTGSNDYDNPYPLAVRWNELPIGTTTTSSGESDDGDPSTDFYEVLEITQDGVTTQTEQNGTPPVASTGDNFENTLVLNDVNDPSLIRYTFPEDLHAWPDLYLMNFETKVKDVVTKIRKLRNHLLVGCREHIIRVNYLPRASDTSFDRGRAYEIVSDSHGVVHENAADTFTTGDGSVALAFVHDSGLYMTDGFKIYPLTEDIDWPKLVLPTHYDQLVLRNYPRWQLLVLFYTPIGETSNTKALFFHYHRTHLKEGGTLKVSGPVTMAAVDADYVHSTAVNKALFMVREDGIVYAADTDPPPLAMTIRSRLAYPENNPFDTKYVQQVVVLHGEHNDPGTLALVGQRFNEPAKVFAPQGFDQDFRGFHRFDYRRNIGGGLGAVITSKAPITLWGTELGQEGR